MPPLNTVRVEFSCSKIIPLIMVSASRVTFELIVTIVCWLRLRMTELEVVGMDDVFRFEGISHEPLLCPIHATASLSVT